MGRVPCSCTAPATHQVDLNAMGLGALYFCGECLPSHLELHAERLRPVVLLRTVFTSHGMVMVYAERLSGGGPAATRIVDAWGEREVLFAKLLVLREARERWGDPERVRFETVDRRSRRQRRASPRVDARMEG